MNELEDGIPARLLEISDKLKRPSETPEEPPKYRYVLVGVILRSSTAFVLEPVTSDDSESQSLSPSFPGYQWWKIDYEASSLNPVQTIKVNEKAVLGAARTTSNSVYLVYASDKALSQERKPLPTQLQNFVKADNLAFQAELDEHETQRTQEMSWKATSNSQDWSNQNQAWAGAVPHQIWDDQPMTNDFPSALSPQKRKAKEAAEDSDMEVERDVDSPAMRSDDDEGFISNGSSPLDPFPFERPAEPFDSSMQQPMQQRLRPLEPKPPAAMGLNGRLPATYQPPPPDQEMKEIKRE